MFRCDFVGTLIVVPDVASINLPGAPSITSGARHKGAESEGVRGLKSLGVRDLHHRMSFLACSVQVCYTQLITILSVLTKNDFKDFHNH